MPKVFIDWQSLHAILNNDGLEEFLFYQGFNIDDAVHYAKVNNGVFFEQYIICLN